MASDPVLLQAREGRWTWPWAVAGTLLTIALIWVLTKLGGSFDRFAERQHWIARGLLDLTLDPRQPFTFASVGIGALPLLVAPLIVLQYFHGVPWRRAFAYRGNFDWALFVRGALALLVVSTLANVFAVAMAPDEFILQPRGLGHVPWALVGLVAIFLAAMGEEVLFKGYLLRVWGAVIPARRPLVVLLVIVFTSLHLGNTDLN